MKVVVIGDILLDIYYSYQVTRNAPEALHLPVCNVKSTEIILGGASNVAYNLSLLDNCNVVFVSVVGNDIMGKHAKKILEEKNIQHLLFFDKKRKTTQKHRLLDHNHTLTTRYDIEDTTDIPIIIQNKIIRFLKKESHIDAIVLSDYNKGLLTTSLCKKIINYANLQNIYTFVDPKIKDFTKYSNCFCFKPNLQEGEQISKRKTVEDILNTIKTLLSCHHVILSAGENGIYVNNPECHFHSTVSKEAVQDVTGAGDIVIVLLVYLFLKTKDILLASKIANFVAGKSVQVIGNYHLSTKDIDEYYLQEDEEEQEEEEEEEEKQYKDQEEEEIKEPIMIPKILSFSCFEDKTFIQIQRKKWYQQQKRVVFTNGCFDILHSAHLKLLKFAKSQGDILVVGLNSDTSIRRLKGSSRPINHVHERSDILSLLDFVDNIIVFEEDTPLTLIQWLHPDILVKGGDYQKETIVGASIVKEVILFDFVQNKSSSLVIEKIIETSKNNNKLHQMGEFLGE